MKVQKKAILCLLVAALMLLGGCKQNPAEEELFVRVMNHFTSLHPTRQKLADSTRAVPIYNASVWYSLQLDDGEEVLVYFDESNRADYLADGIDAQAWGCVGRLGLRFVLVYQGQDERVLELMRSLPEM